MDQETIFSIPFKSLSSILKTFKAINGKDSRVTIQTDVNGDIYFLSNDEFSIKQYFPQTNVLVAICHEFLLEDLLAIKASAKASVEFAHNDDLTVCVKAASTSFVPFKPSSLTAKNIIIDNVEEYLPLDEEAVNKFSKVVSGKEITEWFIFEQMKYIDYNKAKISYLSPVFSCYYKIEDTGISFKIPVKLVKAGIFKNMCGIKVLGDKIIFWFSENGLTISCSQPSFTQEKPIINKTDTSQEILLDAEKLLNAVFGVSSYIKADFVIEASQARIDVNQGEVYSVLDCSATQGKEQFSFSPDLFARAVNFLYNEEKTLIKMKLFSENNVVKYVNLYNTEASVLMSVLK